MPRRLPVVQNEPSEDAEAAARPRFHWVLIAAGLTVTLWAPLVVVAMPLGARLAALAVGVSADSIAGGAPGVSPRRHTAFALIAAAPAMLSFLAAAAMSGALVGRFGGRAGRREASLGAIFAALMVSILSLRSGLGFPVAGIVAGFAMLSALGALGAALGATWGRGIRR
jgi:hypothetical protein